MRSRNGGGGDSWKKDNRGGGARSLAKVNTACRNLNWPTRLKNKRTLPEEGLHCADLFLYSFSNERWKRKAFVAERGGGFKIYKSRRESSREIFNRFEGVGFGFVITNWGRENIGWSVDSFKNLPSWIFFELSSKKNYDTRRINDSRAATF